MNLFQLIRQRRRQLRSDFDIERQMSEIEESCIPSYCHPNPLAAAISWWRLVAARNLYRDVGIPGDILDFGAATGEIAHILGLPTGYHFVEEADGLAELLLRQVPGASRLQIDTLPAGRFATIFALDSLEHNQDVGGLVLRLVRALQPDGRLILSGPTESSLYRLGRRIAGFDGHYHTTTIFDIESTLAKSLQRLQIRSVPPAGSLFRISAWEHRT